MDVARRGHHGEVVFLRQRFPGIEAYEKNWLRARIVDDVILLINGGVPLLFVAALVESMGEKFYQRFGDELVLKGTGTINRLAWKDITVPFCGMRVEVVERPSGTSCQHLIWRSPGRSVSLARSFRTCTAMDQALSPLAPISHTLSSRTMFWLIFLVGIINRR